MNYYAKLINLDILNLIFKLKFNKNKFQHFPGRYFRGRWIKAVEFISTGGEK